MCFPEKRKVVLLAVEENIAERRDLEVLRGHHDARLDSLIEFREFLSIVEQLAEHGILELAVCHDSITSLPLFYGDWEETARKKMEMARGSD